MTVTTSTSTFVGAETILDRVAAGKPIETRYLVLTGADGDPARRGDKKVIAQSFCEYYCPDYATLVRCIKAIKDSDDRLLQRPEEQMKWDWDTTWVSFHNDADRESAGGTIYLGVAWYDREFFDDRKDAGFGAMHRSIYKNIGVPLEEVRVAHFLAAEAAVWKPDDAELNLTPTPIGAHRPPTG